VFAAIIGGLGAALVLGNLAGFAVAVGMVLIAAAAMFAPPNTLRAMLAVVVTGLIGGVAVAGLGAWTVYTALSTTDGTVAPAEGDALASADAKIDAAEIAAAFRLELTEAEMRAYTLEALRDERDNPIADIRFDLSPDGDGRGTMSFVAELKSGGSTAEGKVAARLVAGSVQVDILDLGLGAFHLPGAAEPAFEDLVTRIADFNQLLAERRADVQSITFTETTVVITGTQAGGELLTDDSFLTEFAQQAAGSIDAGDVPDEVYGPGVVDSTSSGSAPFYVAIGDSLAANVGVEDAADGYVSRFHNQLQLRDGVAYGLRNFGVTGETTGTMIRTGQLDEAVAFMESNDVAYVTIDVGANNLLGHLGTADCADSVQTPACQARIADAFGAYPSDLEVIFDELSDAAPDATILFLTAYNPFDLGFGTDLEREMNGALELFNGLAIGVASDHDYVIADGFGAMAGTAAMTTHMLDATPDIHPLPIGYDLLTGALLDALG
jgi:hypothetical protein